MENELQILTNIEKNQNATQRDIAKNTGMSLGNVNILIKRLAKKGMLKVEKLNPRSIRYMLTPEGVKEKAVMTYRYVVESYRFINDISLKMDMIISKTNNLTGSRIILFGERDEIFSMMQDRLINIKAPFIHIEILEDLESNFKQGMPVIVWHPDYADMLVCRNINFFNIMEEL